MLGPPRNCPSRCVGRWMLMSLWQAALFDALQQHLRRIKVLYPACACFLPHQAGALVAGAPCM